MSAKVSTALKRLQAILPLKANQNSCSSDVKQLHQAILKSFIEKGRVLNNKEMFRITEHYQDALLTLQKKDLIVLDGSLNIIGAYPLTTEKREHEVHVNGFSLNAMCALDALSVSSLFKLKTVVSSACRMTQTKIYIEQDLGAVTNLTDSSDIHIGISWSAASSDSCCANNLCLEMLFLINTSIAQNWLSEDKNNREIFTLSESVEFGSLFFDPLLHA